MRSNIQLIAFQQVFREVENLLEYLLETKRFPLRFFSKRVRFKLCHKNDIALKGRAGESFLLLRFYVASGRIALQWCGSRAIKQEFLTILNDWKMLGEMSRLNLLLKENEREK